MGRTMFDRKDAKSAQLDPVAARQGGRDLAENGVGDILNVTPPPSVPSNVTITAATSTEVETCAKSPFN